MYPYFVAFSFVILFTMSNLCNTLSMNVKAKTKITTVNHHKNKNNIKVGKSTKSVTNKKTAYNRDRNNLLSILGLQPEDQFVVGLNSPTTTTTTGDEFRFRLNSPNHEGKKGRIDESPWKGLKRKMKMKVDEPIMDVPIGQKNDLKRHWSATWSSPMYVMWQSLLSPGFQGQDNYDFLNEILNNAVMPNERSIRTQLKSGLQVDRISPSTRVSGLQRHLDKGIKGYKKPENGMDFQISMQTYYGSLGDTPRRKLKLKSGMNKIDIPRRKLQSQNRKNFDAGEEVAGFLFPSIRYDDFNRNKKPAKSILSNDNVDLNNNRQIYDSFDYFDKFGNQNKIMDVNEKLVKGKLSHQNKALKNPTVNKMRFEYYDDADKINDDVTSRKESSIEQIDRKRNVLLRKGAYNTKQGPLEFGHENHEHNLPIEVHQGKDKDNNDIVLPYVDFMTVANERGADKKFKNVHSSHERDGLLPSPKSSVENLDNIRHEIGRMDLDRNSNENDDNDNDKKINDVKEKREDINNNHRSAIRIDNVGDNDDNGNDDNGNDDNSNDDIRVDSGDKRIIIENLIKGNDEMKNKADKTKTLLKMVSNDRGNNIVKNNVNTWDKDDDDDDDDDDDNDANGNNDNNNSNGYNDNNDKDNNNIKIDNTDSKRQPANTLSTARHPSQSIPMLEKNGNDNNKEDNAIMENIHSVSRNDAQGDGKEEEGEKDGMNKADINIENKNVISTLLKREGRVEIKNTTNYYDDANRLLRGSKPGLDYRGLVTKREAPELDASHSLDDERNVMQTANKRFPKSLKSEINDSNNRHHTSINNHKTYENGGDGPDNRRDGLRNIKKREESSNNGSGSGPKYESGKFIGSKHTGTISDIKGESSGSSSKGHVTNYRNDRKKKGRNDGDDDKLDKKKVNEKDEDGKENNDNNDNVADRTGGGWLGIYAVDTSLTPDSHKNASNKESHTPEKDHKGLLPHHAAFGLVLLALLISLVVSVVCLASCTSASSAGMQRANSRTALYRPHDLYAYNNTTEQTLQTQTQPRGHLNEGKYIQDNYAYLG